MSVPRKLWSLLRAGPRRQALVAEATASMLAARIALLRRPFVHVSKRFGAFVPPSDPRVAACPPATTAERRLAREIGWAVRAAAPFMPFRSVCLQQAMAGHAMLRRRGVHSVMHFGARRIGTSEAGPRGTGTSGIDAHAWLDAGGVKVTGYPVEPSMAELGCFV